jgi:hypothetical protein
MPERLNEFDPTQRPRQLRRRAIVMAKLRQGFYAGGWIPARSFLALMDDLGGEIRDEAECVAVLEHLIEHGLLEEWKPMGAGTHVQSFGQRRFKLTDRGYDLWSEKLDPIPSIADERLGD